MNTLALPLLRLLIALNNLYDRKVIIYFVSVSLRQPSLAPVLNLADDFGSLPQRIVSSGLGQIVLARRQHCVLPFHVELPADLIS